jgi:hypothetical protein
MNVPFPSRVILKPSIVSMAAACGSMAAWLFPSFGVLRKGFDAPARLDLYAFVVLACWYLLIFVSFSVGEKLGLLLAGRRRSLKGKLFELESNFLYYTFTLFTAIGVANTLLVIFRSLSFQQAIVFIGLGEANSLKEALYEQYSVGFVSLRYLVLYSASIAIYRMVRLRSFKALNLLNIVMLAISTFILGSRLIFIATLLTSTLLLTFERKSIRVSITKTLALLTCVFLLLSVVNFLRNKNYYETNRLSFAAAGVSEIITYLGSPFQVAIGSARVTDQLAAGGDQAYRDYVDVEINLNTNSAFVHLHEQMGYLSWLYIAVVCTFMGAVFEFLRSYGKTVFLLPCGAILYGSAELWRLDLYHQGIFIVWFVVGIGLPAFLLVWKYVSTHLGGFTHIPQGQLGENSR